MTKLLRGISMCYLFRRRAKLYTLSPEGNTEEENNGYVVLKSMSQLEMGGGGVTPFYSSKDDDRFFLHL